MVATESFGPMDGKPWADQTQWYRHAPQWAPSGIPGTPAAGYGSGELGLSVSGLSISVLAGHAWVRGCGYELSGGTKDFTVPPNTNATLYRRDRVVVRRDIVAKTCGPVLLTGTAAGTPAAVALQRNDAGQWDLPLFSFNTPPASGTVLSNLIDERPWILNDAPPELVAIPVSAGWTAVAGRIPVACIDAAGFISLMGAVTNDNTYTPNSAGPYQMLQLPVGYRPSISTSILIPFGVNPYPMGGSVNPDGHVQVGNFASSVAANTSHSLDGIRFHPRYAGAVWP